MPKSLPQPIIEQNLDDFQTVNLDIDSLIAQYITPIDNIRSIARPAPASSSNSGGTSLPFVNDFQNLQVDNLGKLESLTHAFYRSLGLPVVTSDGSYYNPGFDPTGGKNLDTHISIDQKFASDPISVLIGVREANPQELLQIFANQDLTASVYALVMRYVKPFQVMKDGGNQALDIDAQLFTVADRDTEILLFSSFNPTLSDQIVGLSSSFSKLSGFAFNSGRHILHPFVVDPRVERTVSPDSSRICVPFLPDKNSTKLNARTYLQRPGIEFIIRQRLSDLVADKNFLTDINAVLAGSKAPSVDTTNLDIDDIRSTVAALADQNMVSQSAIDKLSGFTSTQAVTVVGLISTIKGCVKLLADAVKTIDLVKQKINWVPVPSVNGPIAGANGAQLSRVGTSGVGDIDQQINNLRIQQINAQRQIATSVDLGSYALPFSSSVNTEPVSSYQEQLDQLVRKRDSIAAEGFKGMGTIEAITGEISGIGLVDIIAIYVALYSMDISDLLSILDRDSFSRLTDSTLNPDIASLASSSGQSNILTALKNMESIVINVLSFADKLYISNTTINISQGANL